MFFLEKVSANETGDTRTDDSYFHFTGEIGWIQL